MAIPAGARLWPGVMVVHDFAGMSHDLRNQAEWLASEGFLVARWICTAWGSWLWAIMPGVTAGRVAPSPRPLRTRHEAHVRQ